MKKFSKETQGILWTLAVCVSYPILTAVVRHLSDLGMASTQIVFLRNVTALTILVPFVFFKRSQIDIRIRNYKLYFLRIIFGTTSMIFWFYGLGKLPLATATALSFSTPLFVAIMAVIILKEKIGTYRGLAILTGFFGTMIILGTSAYTFNIASYAILGGCFLTSMSLIIIKKLTNTETPFNMMFHMHLWMAFFSIPLAFISWHPIDSNMLAWCYVMAVFSIIGQYGTARSYTLVDVTLTLPFDFTRLIVASVIAYFAFSEEPGIYTFVGAGIIIASSIFITHREARLKRLQKKNIIGKV